MSRVVRWARRESAGVPLLITLLVAGCGGSSSPPRYDGMGDPATVLPASVAAYAAFDGSPRGALGVSAGDLVRRIGGDVPVPQAIVASILRAGGSSVSYDKDVKPWLGRHAAFFATFPGGQVHGGGAFATRDPARALAFERRQLRNQDGNAVRLTYHGTAVLRDPFNETWVATIGQFLLEGDPVAVRAVIDGRRRASLATLPAFQRALASLPAQRIGTFYVDAKRILSKLAPDAIGALMGESAAWLALARSARPVVAAMTVGRESVGFDVVSPSKSGGGGRLLAKLPSDAYLAIEVSGLGQTLRRAVETAKVARVGPLLAGVERSFDRFTGVNLERDLLPWMGDAAGYMGGGFDPRTVHLGVIIAAQRPAPALRAVLLLASALRRRVPLTALRIPGLGQGFRIGPAVGSRIEVVSGPHAAVGVLGGGVADVLRPRTTLAQTASYATAARILGGRPSLLVKMSALLKLAVIGGASRDPQLVRALPYLRRFGVITAGRTADGHYERIALQVR